MTAVIIMAASQSRRDWFQRTLAATKSMHIVGAAATFPFLRSLLEEPAAEVAILDSQSAPEPDVTRDWLFEILDRLPSVLLISAPDAGIFNAVVRAERGALLRTDASPGQIIQAVQSTSAGLLTFDSTLIPLPDSPADLTEELTPRETEVLALLAEGLVNREIASRLSISEHTIKFHIRSILGKLGASTRTEAVTRGLRQGLIEL